MNDDRADACVTESVTYLGSHTDITPVRSVAATLRDNPTSEVRARAGWHILAVGYVQNGRFVFEWLGGSCEATLDTDDARVDGCWAAVVKKAIEAAFGP